MANIKYFSEYQGKTVQLTAIQHNGSCARPKAEHFSGLTPDGTRISAMRMITFKSNPSRHDCDARCVNAKGRTMNCECACGGKNHGKGSTLVCEAG